MALRSSWFCLACVYSCVFLASSFASAVDTDTRDKQTVYGPRHTTRITYRKSKVNNLAISRWYRERKNVPLLALRLRGPLQNKAIKYKFPSVGASVRNQTTELENSKYDVKSKNSAIKFGIGLFTPQKRVLSFSFVKDITEPGYKKNDDDSLSKEMDVLEIVDDRSERERQTSFMSGEELSKVEKVDDAKDGETVVTSEILTDEPKNITDKVVSVNVKHSEPLRNNSVLYQTNNMQTKNTSISFTSKENGTKIYNDTSRRTGCFDVFKCKNKKQKKVKQGVQSELSDNLEIHQNAKATLFAVKGSMNSNTGRRDELKHQIISGNKPTGLVNVVKDVQPETSQSHLHFLRRLLPAWNRRLRAWERRRNRAWNSSRHMIFSLQTARNNATKYDRLFANPSFFHLQNTMDKTVHMITKSKEKKANLTNAFVKHFHFQVARNMSEVENSLTLARSPNSSINGHKPYYLMQPLQTTTMIRRKNTKSKHSNRKSRPISKSFSFTGEKINNFTGKKEHTQEDKALITTVHHRTKNKENISPNFQSFSISSKTTSRPRTSESQRTKANIKIFAQTNEFPYYQTSDNVKKLSTATLQHNRSMSTTKTSQQNKYHSSFETNSSYQKNREKFNANCSQMISNITNRISEDRRPENHLKLSHQDSLTGKNVKIDYTIKTKENNSSHSTFQKLQNASGEAPFSQIVMGNAGTFLTHSEGKPVKEHHNIVKMKNLHSVNGTKKINIPKGAERNESTFTQWSVWTQCSGTCGYGKVKRFRYWCDDGMPDDLTNCVRLDEHNDCLISHCPVDGGFTNWSSWSPCSHTCGRAKKVRVRFCINPVPRDRGKDCRGPRIQIQSCKLRDCTKQTYSADNLTSWEEWSTCSKTCGKDGVQTRQFCVLLKPEKRCTLENRKCKLEPCPNHLSSWSRWSSCSRTCGIGLQRRSRRCPSPEVGYNRKNCSEVKLCNSRCPVHGGFSEWSQWSPCNGCLRNAFRSRRRFCTRPPPAFGGNNCTGEMSDTKKCWRQCNADNKSSESTAGLKSDVKEVGLTEWTSWSLCKGCGYYTLQTRRRFCGSPSVGYHGNTCTGQTLQTRSCRKSCQVDGGFSEWGEWSKCTGCERRAFRRRQRFCTNPKPHYGGKPCRGLKTETKQCHRPCSVDGAFIHWTAWSACSSTCGTGVSVRKRSCPEPRSPYGRKRCRRTKAESRVCNVTACKVDGGFTTWSSWSTCNSSCGSRSYSLRHRSCTNPSPQHGGLVCIGQRFESKSCNKKNCPVDGDVGIWSNYSKCSRTCGGGVRKRVRECNNPRPQYGGAKCSSDLLVETQRCNSSPCPIHIHKWFQQQNEFTTPIEEMLQAELNKCLQMFYLVARKRDGNFYNKKSLTRIRSVIHRHFRNPPQNKPFSIIGDSRFHDANTKRSILFLENTAKAVTYLLQQFRNMSHELANFVEMAVDTNSVSEYSNTNIASENALPVVLQTNPQMPTDKSSGNVSFVIQDGPATRTAWFDSGATFHNCNFNTNMPGFSTGSKSESSVFDIDPNDYCGFNPCEEVKCFASPLAGCITDFDCNPLFFDQHGNALKTCQGHSLYTTIPTELCGYNVCDFTKCKKPESLKCEVNLKCNPTFLDMNGKEIKCKGKYVVKVAPQSVCGFQPCRQHRCPDHPESVCVSDNRCKPVFLDSQRKPIKECEKGKLDLKTTGLDNSFGIAHALKGERTGSMSTKLSWNTRYPNKINVKNIFTGVSLANRKKLFAPHESVQHGDFYDGLVEVQEDTNNDNIEGENEEELNSTEEPEESPYGEEEEGYLEDSPGLDIDNSD